MGIKNFNQDLCIAGCNICIENCPTDVFVLDIETGRARATAAYPEDCWECFLCEEECPAKAIKISRAAVRKIFYPF